MSIDHGKVLALAERVAGLAHMTLGKESREEREAIERELRALAQPAEAVEYDDEIGTDGKPTGYWIRRSATDAAQGAVAPWPDYAGNVIRDKDRIRHPDGVTGTVLHLPAMGRDPWRVVYETGDMSRLNLQIGDKGQAVVVHPQAAPAQGDVPPEVRNAIDFLTGLRVFVTSRQRIKEPEGDNLFDESVATIRKWLAAAPSQEGE